MIVDCQVHLWKAETPERPWPSWGRSYAHLPEPMTYERMLAFMDSAGVDRAIIVPPSWEGDRIDYGMEASAKYPNRFAVMGRIALDKSVSHDSLRSWMSQPGILGVRLTFSNGKESWLEDGTADWFWPLAADIGIPVMMLPQVWTPRIGGIAAEHPKLKLIIDHMGLTTRIVNEGKTAEAIERTVALARHPNVFVKLSNALSHSRQQYPFRDMHSHVQKVVQAFGAERCFWGTDLTLKYEMCSYRERLTAFTEEMPFLSKREKELIMGNAILQCLNWPA